MTFPELSLIPLVIERMADIRYQQSHAVVRRLEGGYHPGNNKRDRNPTMWGVTERTFHAWLTDRKQALRPVREITEKEAGLIYRTRYWDPSRAIHLPWPMCLVHFDAWVNHGGKWPPTFRREYPNDFLGYLRRRHRFYDAIIRNNPDMEGNRNGWYNRLWVLSIVGVDDAAREHFVKTGRYPERPADLVVRPAVQVS